MNIFTGLLAKIREVLRRLIPYRNIEQAEQIEMLTECVLEMSEIIYGGEL